MWEYLIYFFIFLFLFFIPAWPFSYTIRSSFYLLRAYLRGPINPLNSVVVHNHWVLFHELDVLYHMNVKKEEKSFDSFF